MESRPCWPTGASRARSKRETSNGQGSPRKDQARIERRYRTLLHDQQEQADDPGKARTDEVRSGRPQARRVQRSQTQVTARGGATSPRAPLILSFSRKGRRDLLTPLASRRRRNLPVAW